MFAISGTQIIAKYVIYYEKKVPQELETVVAYDPSMSLVKGGLADLRGFRIPKTIATIKDTEPVANKLRLKSFEELLKKLLTEGKIEHFVRLS